MNKMDLTQRLENCYSGAVFDVMRELGMKDGLLPRHLKSLDPEVTVCGPVSTILGRPDTSLTEDESLYAGPNSWARLRQVMWWFVNPRMTTGL